MFSPNLFLLALREDSLDTHEEVVSAGNKKKGEVFVRARMWRDTSLSAATREARLSAIRARKLKRERAARKREEEARLDELNRDKVEAVKLEHEMQREEFEALYMKGAGMSPGAADDFASAATALQARWRGVSGRSKCRHSNGSTATRNVARRQRSALSKSLGRQRRAAVFRKHVGKQQCKHDG